jgi:hypothetical protein
MSLAFSVLNGYKLIVRGDYQSLNMYAFFYRINALVVLRNQLIYIDEYDYFQKVKDTLLISTFLPSSVTGIENKDISNEFGHEIHLLNPKNFETVVHPTHIGELYYNMGVPGVFLGGCAIAIGLKILASFAKASDKNIILLAFMIFSCFVNYEKTFTYLLAGIFRNFYLWFACINVIYIASAAAASYRAKLSPYRQGRSFS